MNLQKFIELYSDNSDIKKVTNIEYIGNDNIEIDLSLCENLESIIIEGNNIDIKNIPSKCKYISINGNNIKIDNIESIDINDLILTSKNISYIDIPLSYLRNITKNRLTLKNIEYSVQNIDKFKKYFIKSTENIYKEELYNNKQFLKIIDNDLLLLYKISDLKHNSYTKFNSVVIPNNLTHIPHILAIAQIDNLYISNIIKKNKLLWDYIPLNIEKVYPSKYFVIPKKLQKKMKENLFYGTLTIDNYEDKYFNILKLFNDQNGAKLKFKIQVLFKEEIKNKIKQLNKEVESPSN